MSVVKYLPDMVVLDYLASLSAQPPPLTFNKQNIIFFLPLNPSKHSNWVYLLGKSQLFLKKKFILNYIPLTVPCLLYLHKPGTS